MPVFKACFVVLFASILGSTAALAQDPLSLEGASAEFLAHLQGNPELISDPSIEAWSVTGADQKHVNVNTDAVPGGIALRIEVKRAANNNWDIGARQTVSGTIKKGDIVLLAYYARGVRAYNEANTAVITSSQIELSRTPYTSVAHGAARLSKDWTIYYVSGRADRHYASGEAQISLHLGAAQQTLELGPAFVFNFGPDINLRDLPSNRLFYEGREDDAPWRAAAAARIEAHRKGDLDIVIMDKSGKRVSDVKVHAAMTRHAYGFGTFVNHDFVKSDGSMNSAIHSKFGELFNMATSPIYWADWGWQSEVNRPNYEATAQYLTQNDIPWRAHTIVWPGEKYMPSILLEMDGDPKAQRQWVLDHTRQVMNFIGPLNPIAIDLVNEPRVNQYFKSNGNPNLVEESFKLAHSIAPDIALFVNDYAILNGGGINQSNIEFYKNWLDDMQSREVPVGGIGFQSHFSADLTSPQRVYDILDEFDRFGLPIHITEFDVETLDEQAQADYTRDFVTIVFSHPRTEAFMMWGFWAGDHWKPDGAMYREDWTEKPNGTAWRKLVYETFWTDETLMSDEAGTASLRGFYGDYDITITPPEGAVKRVATRLEDGAENIVRVTLD